MGWWKADPVETQPELSQLPQQSPSRVPLNHPPVAEGVSQESCPVDHKTREIWLQAAQKQRQKSRDNAATDIQRQETCPVDHNARQSWLGMAKGFLGSSDNPSIASSPPQSERTRVRDDVTPKVSLKTASTDSPAQCSSDTISDLPEGPSIVVPHGRQTRTLSHDREVSTIPRGHPTAGASSPYPSNNEQETGTSTSGNWIYPSETQFFNAVMRKSTTTTSAEDLAQSVSSIIPIHNAVNERAWHLIKQWEGNASKACGGPKLLSFQGLGAGALSPKAKWNSMVKGAKEPFDRHDWVVERCGGQQVEYVIDFYSGKERDDVDPKKRQQELNFFLDVRPKLNSFEGCRMRAEKLLGLR